MIRFEEYDVVVVGCGLSGAAIARVLADNDKKVLILEKRNHIAGNMFDYVNKDGILVQQYGPHTFHTNKKELFDFMEKYGEWEDYKLTCGAVIDDKYTPTPFNYQTIDDFYNVHEANELKSEIEKYYEGKEFATVLELLEHESLLIRQYATFLFEKDYSLYTAKQWGVKPEEIDPSVLKRVPIRFSYREGYFEDKYQVMPQKSFVSFFDKLLNHDKIHIHLNVDAKDYISFVEDDICFNGKKYDGIVVYTGPLDELFDLKYGKLPYRSLRFEWKTESKKSFQPAPVVAYPQTADYTRITEYTKLPVQEVGEKTTYAIEYSIPYKAGEKVEPYYPVLTEESQKMCLKYQDEILQYENLYVCGRLGDFKYYNMDQALDRALNVAKEILNEKVKKCII